MSDKPVEIAELRSQYFDIERLRSVLINVLASARPNKKEHPTMWAAWEDAKAVLESTQRFEQVEQENASLREQVEQLRYGMKLSEDQHRKALAHCDDLSAQVKRLSAPVSDEEWDDNVEWRYDGKSEKMLRKDVDSLIADRAKPSEPSR
jgi:hypothetical protein